MGIDCRVLNQGLNGFLIDVETAHPRREHKIELVL